MIADLKPYPEYRTAEGGWLGQVPSHWHIRRMKYVLREVDARSIYGKEQLLRVSQYTGVTQRIRNDGLAEPDTRADSLVGYKLVSPDQLAINIMLAWNGSMGVSRYSGIVSPAYGVYRFVRPAYPWFFHHLLRSPIYKARIKAASTGVVDSRLRLYSDDLGRLEAIVPPSDEQVAIVRFLDWANGRLERAIRAKRKVIALLNEQKQAIIHSAVTRGLDASISLKPSCVEWLGDIPQHWQVRRLKFVASKIVDCLHATPLYSESGEYPAIRTADISPGAIHLVKAKKISAAAFLRWTERLKPTFGDILYSREGERFGIAACVPAGAELCISQRMMVFRIGIQHSSSFVMWLLNSNPTYEQALQDVTGATAPHINISTIRNYVLAIPPFDEQQKIAAYINEQVRPIGDATARLEKEIELIREYRTRLISDVVTGKLDVRDAAVQLPASEERENSEVDEGEFDLQEADEEAVA